MTDEPSTSRGLGATNRRNKFNAKFPPTRIKKVIQIDEEIGKMAGSVPALIGRSVELFAEQLLKKSFVIANTRDAKTLTPQHMKAAVYGEPMFSFLQETFSKIPDVSTHLQPAMPTFSQPTMISADKQSLKGTRKRKGDDISWNYGNVASSKMKVSSRRATLPAELSEEDDEYFDDFDRNGVVRKCSAPGSVEKRSGSPLSDVGVIYAKGSSRVSTLSNGFANSESS